MNRSEINELRTSVATDVAAGRLNDAINRLRALPQLPYDIASALDAVQQHYSYMLSYFADGMADPGRSETYEQLRADIRTLADRCVRMLSAESSSALYYNNVRTLAMRGGRTLSDAAAEYLAAVAELAGTFDLAGLDGRTDALQSKTEQLDKELFARVWTAFPLDNASADAISSLIGIDSSISHAARMRLIAATGLGLLEFYDVRRFSILADVVDYSPVEGEALAALTWLLLALFRFRARRHPRQVLSRLAAASEHPLWSRRVGAVYAELLQARDTERVVRRVRDEMMPDIMAMGKEMWGERRLDELFDAGSEPDINPEWEEKMRESGMYDRMREFSEMTAEGADIFMGAFAHLKSFPFFRDIEAWFTPFDESQRQVSAAMCGDAGTFVELLGRLPVPCDNDKYSILFSIDAMPAAQREMMGRQLDANRAALEQSGVGESAAGESLAARAYVQNLYRFFKLYQRKNEFFDPFARGIMLLDCAPLRSVLHNPDHLRRTAETLFRINAWADALACYNALMVESEPTAEIYQKCGYCNEQLGRIAEAVECYTFADLMDGTSAWTLRRLAAVLRLSGRPEQAVDVLSRLCRLQPDARSSAVNLAYALIESRHYAEAAAQLHSVVADGKSDERSLWRPMAWCSFMAGDYDRSREYYERVLSDNPDAKDYLNMGHLAWVEGRMSDAVNLYGRSLAARGADMQSLRDALRADLAMLASKGVSSDDLPLILDAVQLRS